MSEDAIRVEHVSKMYRLYNSPSGRLKEALFRGRRKYHMDYWAMKDVSLTVARGNTVGVVGRNGSGKSTLLQLVAGILTPTSGKIYVNGRISALLELGSGFDPEFSGRENVYLNGSILGMTQDEIDDRFEDIERFADIGGFIDQPVKLYSSGMYVRLAFATAVNVDPDILLVDEALAVGDVVFQHRCMRKIREIQEQGKTILFVSHDVGAVRKLCSQAVLIENGGITHMGETDGVVQAYYKTIWHADEKPLVTDDPIDAQDMSSDPIDRSKDIQLQPIQHYDNRFGSRVGEIIAVGLMNEAGQRADAVTGGQKLHLSLQIKCHEPVDMPLVGFMVKDLLGNELIATNTDAEGHYLKACPAGMHIRITFSFVMPHFKAGSYAISAGFGNGTLENHKAYDWIENVAVFAMETSEIFYGMVRTHIDVTHNFIENHGTEKTPA